MSYKRTRETFESDYSPQPEHAPYALYGSPLPPIDREARDDGSYVPLWKQEVRDERGRKRLHGAFTGGFSAGYFNTVGSKEGWTPSTFVSSRQNRAKPGEQQQQQRPEDFMDDEDIREAEEARTLQTTSDFAGFGSTATDANRLGALMGIFRPTGETIGVKLLKRMGWKEGQGIGPKVRRRANLGIGRDVDADSGGKTYLFAPENTSVVSFIRKNDTKGLGFEGETRLGRTRNDQGGKDDGSDEGIDGGKNSSKGRDRLLNPNGDRAGKSGPRARGGIGIGILNDTGSDDEDPYEIGPRISYNRVIGQDKKSKKKNKDSESQQRTLRASNPLLDTKPIFMSKKRAAALSASHKTKSGFRKCHDGRLPLEGFLLGLTIFDSSDKMARYAPPKIPKDWQSSRTPTTTTQEPPTSNYVSTAEAAKNSSLDPKSRAAILGETQLPGKSIFDYMTPEGRERLVKATGKTDLPPALGEKPPKGFESSEVQKQRDLWNLIPKLDKTVATQALSRAFGGWTPYTEDEMKRDRYRMFLEIQAGLNQDELILPRRAPGATTEEWLAELHEFTRAAEVFKPASGLMASRFTSASSLPQSSESQAPTATTGTLLQQPGAAKNKFEDPAEAAAKLGMYGPMTRLSLPFSPSRLLCKRFNVRPPANFQPEPTASTGAAAESGHATPYDSNFAPGTSKLELVSRDTMNKLMMDAAETSGRRQPFTTSETGSEGQEQQQERRGREPPSEQMAKMAVAVDPARNEALEAPRPGEEVFKAIFGSDDEDKDE